MKLTDPWFEAEFVGRIAKSGTAHHWQGAEIEGAQAVFLYLRTLLRQGRRRGLRRLPCVASGSQVLYYGRTGEAHTEHFPGAD